MLPFHTCAFCLRCKIKYLCHITSHVTTEWDGMYGHVLRMNKEIIPNMTLNMNVKESALHGDKGQDGCDRLGKMSHKRSRDMGNT